MVEGIERGLGGLTPLKARTALFRKRCFEFCMILFDAGARSMGCERPSNDPLITIINYNLHIM